MAFMWGLCSLESQETKGFMDTQKRAEGHRMRPTTLRKLKCDKHFEIPIFVSGGLRVKQILRPMQKFHVDTTYTRIHRPTDTVW